MKRKGYEVKTGKYFGGELKEGVVRVRVRVRRKGWAGVEPVGRVTPDTTNVLYVP